MSETEMTDEVEIMEGEDEATSEQSDEGEQSSGEEITLEQAISWKQELEKARKKIAHLSKENKTVKSEKTEQPANTDPLSDLDRMTEAFEQYDFYKKNPNAKAEREEIESMYQASKGKFTREEIYGKLSGDAEVEENRKVYAKSSVTGKQSSSDSFAAISIDQYDKLSGADQKAYNAASKAKFGGVKFKE